LKAKSQTLSRYSFFGKTIVRSAHLSRPLPRQRAHFSPVANSRHRHTNRRASILSASRKYLRILGLRTKDTASEFNIAVTTRKKLFVRHYAARRHLSCRSSLYGVTSRFKVTHEISQSLFNCFAILIAFVTTIVLIINKSQILRAESISEFEDKLDALLSKLKSDSPLKHVQEINMILQALDALSLEDIDEKVLISIRGLLSDIDKYLDKRNDKSQLLKYYFERGKIWDKKERYYDAYEDFKKVITLDNKHVYAHNNIGVIFLKIEAFEVALKEFELALEYGLVDDEVSKEDYALFGKNKEEVKSLLPQNEPEQEKLGAAEDSIKQMTILDRLFFKFKKQVVEELGKQVRAEQIDYKSTPLHFAVRKGEVLTDSLLAEHNKDEYDESGETALIIAARNGDVNAVAALTETGANPTKRSRPIYQKNKNRKVNIKCELPLQYAIAAGHWRVVIELLEKTTYFFDRDYLEEFIDDDVPKYKGHGHTKPSDMAVLRRCVSELVAKPIINVINLSSTESRQHLLAYRSLREWDDRETQGMEMRYFLMLRSYFLTNVLFKLKEHKVENDIIQPEIRHDNKPGYYTRKEVKKALIDELHVTLETLYSHRIAQQIAHKLKNKQMPREFLEPFKEAFIKSHVRKMLEMPEEDEYIFPTGYAPYTDTEKVWFGSRKVPKLGHAVYVAFFKRNDKLNVRVDNLGKGYGRHEESKSGNIYPCYLGELKDDKDLAFYLDVLLTERYLDSCGEKPLEKIYHDDCKKLPEWEEDENKNAWPKQEVSNCVMINFGIGSSQRMGHYLYDWYLDEEGAILTALIRPKLYSPKEQAEPTVSPGRSAGV